MNVRTMIFHMSIPSDNTFPLVPTVFALWPLPWSLTYLLKTLTLLFYMNILLDKISQRVPTILTSWPWPRRLTYFFKTLNLLINFEQWVIELWYFTWVFYETKTPSGTNNVDLVILTLWSWPLSLAYFLKTLILLITFEEWVLELWYFTWIFLVIRSICWYLTFWPWFLTNLKKKDIGHNFQKIKYLELPYCTWSFLVTRSFYWYQNICHCDLGHLWNGHYRGQCFTNTSVKYYELWKSIVICTLEIKRTLKYESFLTKIV